MRRFRDILSVALFSLALSASADAQETQAQSPAVKTSSHILGPVHVREKYISMTGPVVQGSATLEGPVWVTGFRVDVLNDKGESESPEYLCHAWVTLGNRFLQPFGYRQPFRAGRPENDDDIRRAGGNDVSSRLRHPA